MKLATVILGASLILGAASSAAAQCRRGPGNGQQNRSAFCPRLDPAYPVQQLSSEEAARLLLLREEEKLALDIYETLAQKWGLRIFGNIAAAEKRHFDAIGSLFSRYELSDPALPARGAFTDAGVQKLYNELLARGQRSIADALQVGVTIEEQDIDDLRDAMSITDNRDILAVYGNLLNGSSNHLSAFRSRLHVTNNQ